MADGAIMLVAAKDVIDVVGVLGTVGDLVVVTGTIV